MRAFCNGLFLLLGTFSYGQFRTPIAYVSWNGWTQAIDTNGRILASGLSTSPLNIDYYAKPGSGLVPYMRNHRLGFKNLGDKIVIPPVYLPVDKMDRSIIDNSPDDGGETTSFRDGQAVVMSPGGKYGIINTSGKLVADTVYDYISPPERGPVYAARISDALFILNRKGRNILRGGWQTDPRIAPRPRFCDGLLCVMRRVTNQPYVDLSNESMEERRAAGKADIDPIELHTYRVGFVNFHARLVIDTGFELGFRQLGNRNWDPPPEFPCRPKFQWFSHKPADPFYARNEYYRFRGGRALAAKDGKNLIIDTSGHVVYELNRGGTLTNFFGMLLVEGSKRQYGGLNDTGDLSPPPRFSLYNRNGKLMFDRLWDDISILRGNGFKFRNRTDSGIYTVVTDSLGRLLSTRTIPWESPGEQERAHELGLWSGALSDEESALFYNSDANYSGPAGHLDWQIDSADHTPGTRVCFGVRSATGAWIVQPVYAELKPFVHGRAAFCRRIDGKRLWGYLDRHCEEVIPARYEDAESFGLMPD